MWFSAALNGRVSCARIATTMKANKVGRIASGVALLGIAIGSSALTLGRSQGVAWVGKPLDLQIHVLSDNLDDMQADCLAADVQYGETHVDPSRVTVSASALTGSAGGKIVRVVATLAVDEPVVTVLLRVGCQQKLSKRYTLFAELPTSVVEPVVPSLVRSSIGPDRVAAVGAVDKPSRQVSLNSAQVATTVAPAKARRSRPAKSEVEPIPVAASAVVPRASKPPARTPGKARLKLDPLELMIERDPVLRASDELLTIPQEDGAIRVQAAALWRSLNVSPEQLLQDEAKALSLEQGIKSLHAVTTQNQKDLVELTARVQQTESKRYSNWLVFTLAGLWLATLAASLWFLRRGRVETEPAWLHGHDAEDSLLAEIVQVPSNGDRPPVTSVRSVAVSPRGGSPVAAAVAAAVAVKGAAQPAAPALTEVDFDLDFGLPPAVSMHGEPSQASTESNPSVLLRLNSEPDFLPSTSPGLRSTASEEVVDVREQAEFFLSLGQHDRAIEILTSRIAQCGESSPLVCLDLLNIYHALGRETDFEFMRTEFNHWFSGHVPEFAAFGNVGQSLDQYPKVMAEISQRWPTVQVLEYIEGLLYHHAGDGVVFDLQAYLDLVFLHGVARQIVRQGGPSGVVGTGDVLRIPAPVNAGLADDPWNPLEKPKFEHRAGAHRRGAQLGAMRLPVAALPESPEADQRAPVAENLEPTHSDFNFLGLR